MPHRDHTFTIETKPAAFCVPKAQYNNKSNQFVTHVGDQQDYLTTTAITWFVYFFDLVINSSC